MPQQPPFELFVFSSKIGSFGAFWLLPTLAGGQQSASMCIRLAGNPVRKSTPLAWRFTASDRMHAVADWSFETSQRISERAARNFAQNLPCQYL